MEKLFETPKQDFEIVCRELGVDTPEAVYQLYFDEDQRLMKESAWDYEDPNLLTNRIYELVAGLNEGDLKEEDATTRQKIMWLWNHHAVSCAMAIKGDKLAAQKFASEAMEHRVEDIPNHITGLLYLLSFDRRHEAGEWVEKIDDETEKSTALSILEKYDNGTLIKKIDSSD